VAGLAGLLPPDAPFVDAAVVDAVAPLPVVAAGGIGDGRGLAAVLCLGAGAAWLGTRFIATTEAPFDPVYKDAIVRASVTDTLYSSLFDGGWPDAPHRALRNSTVREWERAGQPPTGERPGEGQPVAEAADGTPILRYDDALPSLGSRGNLEALALYAGQSAGLVRSVRPVREVIISIVDDAEAVLAAPGGRR
jgi:NAD(P)H-dependent flavin oxidoreductase YrpB (nitropropane dioxygenase family)